MEAFSTLTWTYTVMRMSFDATPISSSVLNTLRSCCSEQPHSFINSSVDTPVSGSACVRVWTTRSICARTSLRMLRRLPSRSMRCRAAARLGRRRDEGKTLVWFWSRRASFDSSNHAMAVRTRSSSVALSRENSPASSWSRISPEVATTASSVSAWWRRRRSSRRRIARSTAWMSRRSNREPAVSENCCSVSSGSNSSRQCARAPSLPALPASWR